MNKDGVVVDTETTGLLMPELADNALQPQIIEIYLGRFNSKLKIIDQFESLVMPVYPNGQQIPIEKHITRITKIDDDMVINSPTFAEIQKQISNFCKGADLIVGANVMFDYYVMLHNFIRVKKKKNAPKFKEKHCVIEMGYCIKNKRMRNSALYEHFKGREMGNVHRAKDDALGTFEIYKEMLKAGY